MALVSCCLQKIAGPVARAAVTRGRGALAARARRSGSPTSPRGRWAWRRASTATIAAREARYALHRLLRARGVEVVAGEEMRGINRRRAHAGLAALAGQALALRGLAPASEEEIRRHEVDARERYGLVRRLSLPRNMLARLVEVAVVLDRAAALEESGQRAQVVTLFDGAVSPRNIALFASREEERLP